MKTTFDRTIFFDAVRPLFGGALTQQQVDGMTFILDAWEKYAGTDDIRWLANFLAQSFHETAQKMWPIAEYNGAQQSYGQIDPETGQRYFGRGLIQCTHRENYRRADEELGFTGDDRCEWNADLQLKPDVSARTGYRGMVQGWFRSDSAGPHTLSRYFNETVDDPVGSRNIINGDRNTVPSWSNGVSIGTLVAGYHAAFLAALEAALVTDLPEPPPFPAQGPVEITVTFRIRATGPVTITVADEISHL